MLLSNNRGAQANSAFHPSGVGYEQQLVLLRKTVCWSLKGKLSRYVTSYTQKDSEFYRSEIFDRRFALTTMSVQNKKLSYRRETARQLPTWRGLGAPAHYPSAPSDYTYAYSRIRKPQRTYVKRTVH